MPLLGSSSTLPPVATSFGGGEGGRLGALAAASGEEWILLPSPPLQEGRGEWLSSHRWRGGRVDLAADAALLLALSSVDEEKEERREMGKGGEERRETGNKVKKKLVGPSVVRR